ncbi:MAG TPA: RNA polymerase subunit sigma-24 [Clostridium sp.]|uniref:RNA polymerase subunit sigma-24 n=1 Tax=Clostridium sp. TaxID=1506 RepID=UPI002F939454
MGDIEKKKVIELYIKGLSYKEIGNEIGSTSEAVRKFISRNAKEEQLIRKAERKSQNTETDYGFEFEHSNFLSVNDLKEIREEKNYGIMPNESIGDYSFLKVNRQSYILSKNHKKLVFDESRGLRTYAVPKSY